MNAIEKHIHEVKLDYLNICVPKMIELFNRQVNEENISLYSNAQFIIRKYYSLFEWIKFAKIEEFTQFDSTLLNSIESSTIPSLNHLSNAEVDLKLKLINLFKKQSEFIKVKHLIMSGTTNNANTTNSHFTIFVGVLNYIRPNGELVTTGIIPFNVEQLPSFDSILLKYTSTGTNANIPMSSFEMKVPCIVIPKEMQLLRIEDQNEIDIFNNFTTSIVGEYKVYTYSIPVSNPNSIFGLNLTIK